MITDYLGNEIKAGQDVCFIKVIYRPAIRRVGFFIPSSGKQKWSPYLNDKTCFEIGEYYRIYENETWGLYYNLFTKYSHEVMPLESSFIFDYSKEEFILAIKGISDDKEIYLKSKS